MPRCECFLYPQPRRGRNHPEDLLAHIFGYWRIEHAD